MMRWVLQICLLLFAAEITSGSVISCGGFVNTLNNVDRSAIRVRLLTPEGHQKYEAECNPENGYYMIPIYNKGQYKFQIVPPEGWVYEKDTVDVIVDGEHDECTKGVDINFNHVGFAISGKVKSGEIGGPSGFKLGLYTPDGKLVEEAVTDDQGKYVFNAVPGSYVVYNVDKDAQCIERGEVPVKVSNAPVAVQPDISISGHLLTVKVVDESGGKLSGVKVTLFSKKKLNLVGFGKREQPTVSPNKNGFNYVLNTVDGLADFPCLPPDEYSIIPTQNIDKIELNFEPKTSSFVMKSANEVVEFKVSGFSTSGQVVLGASPIAGAKVYFDGQAISETDQNGRYYLKDITSGTHRITAQKQHFEFGSVQTDLSPHMPNVPDITVERVDICGSLKIESHLLEEAFVSIVSATGRIRAEVDSEGSFCSAVIPGQYSVFVEGIPPVTPESHEVNANKAPVLNLLFTQFKANIEISVNCFGECSEYEVVLNNDQGVVSKIPASPKIVFSDVVPGHYSLSMVGNKPTCWDNDNIDIHIEDKDVDGVSFKQTGYKLFLDSQYPVKVDYVHSTRTSVKGVGHISNSEKFLCVPAAGEYSLTFSACHQFEAQAITAVAPSTKPFKIVARKARIDVTVETSSATKEKFELILRTENFGEQTFDETSASASEHVFSFYVDMENANNQLKLIPKSREFLFQPESLSFIFDGSCNKGTLKFTSEKGVFIEGSVVPPVEGVNVKAVNQNDKDAEVLTTVTDKKGQYAIGPVARGSKYEAEVEKEGYKFVKTSANVYTAVKLSELRVSFIDTETKKPLGEVLASISGVDNYRSNQIVGPSGTQSYIDLRPGDYYVIAVLQEYQFDKGPVKITVKEGKVESVVLEGKRFAWSAFGKVVYLNGRPIPSIRVEALSKECGNLQEDAVTDEAGKYRIRGLKLDCSYRISPKLPNAEYSLYPPYIKNVVKREDRTNVDFVMTTFKQTFEMHGKLNFNDVELHPISIKVSLLQKSTVIQTLELLAPLQSFIFVHDTAVDGDVFTVLIEDVKTNRIFEAKKQFTVAGPFISMEFDIVSKQKAADVLITSNNYFGIGLIGFIAFVFFYPDKARPLLDYGHQLFNVVKTIATENTQRRHSPDNRRRK